MVKLTIVPLGKVPEEMLTEITEELRTAFEVATETSLPIGMPKDFYNSFRHQYNASSVLNFLAEKFKGKVLGITDEDLYAGDLNFVFGQAQMNGTAAIVSIHRLNPSFYKQVPNKQLLAERAVKEAVHEVGHMLGLRHCLNEKCVMVFSNTIYDVDRKTKELCDRCSHELGIYR
jgi:archaemetzincin